LKGAIKQIFSLLVRMSKITTRQKTVIFAMVIAIFVSSSTVAVSPSSPSHNNSMEIAYAQTLSGQTLQVPNEQTMNDVRGSRLVLLEGIDNAIQRLIESESGTSIQNQPTEGFDTTHIGAAIEELTS
jgi:hypothetical protein